MAPLSITRQNEIELEYADVFKGSIWKRYGGILAIAAIILYSLYCWWFFSVGEKLRTANWQLAGAYLADWISWEARPDIRIDKDGGMEIRYPRFSALGDDPKPEWVTFRTGTITREIEVVKETADSAVTKKVENSFMVPDAKGTMDGVAPAEKEPSSAIGFMAPDAPVGGNTETTESETKRITEDTLTSAVIGMGNDNTVSILPDKVTVSRDGEEMTILLGKDETVRATGTLPAWAEQKYQGRKVIAWFGFDGRAEIDYDGVKIWRRFLGWENFIFDTASPFWGKSFGEVTSLIFSGERLDPQRSNLSLAWNNILYNAEWQHLDVWVKLLQTIVMAFVGTLFAALVAFPLAFLAARNITRSRFMNQLWKRFFDFQRSVDMFIWALFFTRAFGPGPLAGISAIFFTDTGTLGKLYSESLENIDDKQREGVKSVGASPMAVQRYGVLPQVLPLFASQALYFWESNTRSATIIGAVGAGGIGLKLWEAMRTNQDWENVAYMVVLILIVVFLFDNISNALRSRLMGEQRH